MSKVIRCYKPGGEFEDIEQTLTLEELQRRLSGYVEVRNFGFVSVACDEEGKVKGLPFCRRISSTDFVGDIYVGKFTDSGLLPVDSKLLETFESMCAM